MIVRDQWHFCGSIHSIASPNHQVNSGSFKRYVEGTLKKVLEKSSTKSAGLVFSLRITLLCLSKKDAFLSHTKTSIQTWYGTSPPLRVVVGVSLKIVSESIHETIAEDAA